VIAATRPLVSVPFEAHLMIVEPDDMLPRWVEAGCEMVIVHAETCLHLHRTLAQIAELGAKAGVALNPATPLDAVKYVLDLMDLLLIMTVNPGFGGQSYIATMEPKIREASHLIASGDRRVELEVDGGIGPDTVAGAARAGARALVAGSALYRDPEGLEHAVKDLRSRAEEACLW
jgi:ribulose-phosphate 3-epimerase